MLAGFIDGTWPEFERSVQAGLACELAAATAVSRTDPDLTRSVAVAFRRERGLLAGDQLRTWLAERGVTPDDWAAYLRRSVLRERCVESLDGILARQPVPVEDVARILPAEVACNGILRRCATTVIGWAAAASSPALGVAPERPQPDHRRVEALTHDVTNSAAGSRLIDLGTADIPMRLGRLLALRAAYEWFLDEVSSEVALRGCLDSYRLAWLRFRGTELRCASHGAAREALMCLREDGLDPGEVVRLAGAELRELAIVLQEAEPALASLLVSAQPGDVLGPLEDDAGRIRLLLITERVAPSLGDPELFERARREVVRAALESLTAGMVRWHGDL